MPRFISLLRGINVGSSTKIPMAELRSLFESLGFTDIRTLLQTGNIVFDSEETDRAKVAKQIEAAVEQQFGFHSEIIMRTPDELAAIMQNNPLLAGREDDSLMLVVVFLAREPDAAALNDLAEAHSGPELFELKGQDLYVYYPNGQGRSKFSNNFIERKLKTPGTARNWNTVTKLHALAGS